MRLILHAGTHKTATKTLQHFAYEHREALAHAGLVYPERTTVTGDKVWRSHNWIAQALTGVRADAVDEVRDLLRTVRAQAPDEARLLVSAEDLSACCDGRPLWQGLDRSDFRVLQRRYLARVAAHLSAFDVEVVLVFRRADEFAHSLYQTLIKGDHFRGDFQAFLGYAAPLFDYRGQFDAFAATLGKVRTMSYHSFGSAPARRFLEATGVAVPDAEAPMRNVSTDARLTEWMARSNAAGSTPRSLVELQKRFAHSKAARKLFDDFGQASFWRSDAERQRFQDRAAHGFGAISFPPLQGWSAVAADLDEGGLERIDAAFARWRERLEAR